jgi:ABC-type Na+ efflux pump permease subunit
MAGTYSIKFNRELFRRHVVHSWIEFAIGTSVTAALGVLTFKAAERYPWLTWVSMFLTVAFFWCLIAGLWVAGWDTLEYRRMHVHRRKLKTFNVELEHEEPQSLD